MYSKPYPKLLLSLLLSCALSTSAAVASEEKPTSTASAVTVNAPSVKQQAKPKSTATAKSETKAKSKKVRPKKKPKQHSARHPNGGMSMKKVRKHYGEPTSIRKSKGKVKKRWPRITVWSYDQYSVYFERNTVLHTVIH